jgi:Tfp pilus assembly protein PilE
VLGGNGFAIYKRGPATRTSTKEWPLKSGEQGAHRLMIFRDQGEWKLRPTASLLSALLALAVLLIMLFKPDHPSAADYAWTVPALQAIWIGHLSRSSLKKDDSPGATARGLVNFGLAIAYASLLLIILSVSTSASAYHRGRRQTEAALTMRQLVMEQLYYSQDHKGYTANIKLFAKTVGCDVSGDSCSRNNYKFSLAGVACDPGNDHCADFVLFATPGTATKDEKDFCATKDTMIRARRSDSPPAPAISTVAECVKLGFAQ